MFYFDEEKKDEEGEEIEITQTIVLLIWNSNYLNININAYIIKIGVNASRGYLNIYNTKIIAL